MKRSEINSCIREAEQLFKNIGFRLPPFASWSPEKWMNMGHEADEIRENGLGWDVTDFGLGEFMRTGLLLFTIRNGTQQQAGKYPKGYAEKIMVVHENQLTPMHYHWNKREDIINRGGGNLVVELYKSDGKQGLSEEIFSASVDGIRRSFSAGDRLVLTPGESICLEPEVYHCFYGQVGKGPVVVGEVSDANDDDADNCFLEPRARFPEIVEDEAILYYLCNEYPPAVES